MNYSKLKAEITNDPLTRGYSGMTDQQVVDSLNTSDRNYNKPSIGVDEIYDALDLTEFAALSADNKARVDRILSMGGSVKVQGNVKTELASIFGSETATRTALLAAIKTTQTRASELGVGNVNAGDVNVARSL